MDIETFLGSVPDLTDLELAVLLSLIAQQHCIVSTDEELLDDLSTELALIVSEVFGLSYTVVLPEDQTSVEKFGEAILTQDQTKDLSSGEEDGGNGTGMHHGVLLNVGIRAGSRTTSQQNLDTRMVTNVVIARDFDLAPRDVQIAALELMRNRRIYSRTTVHPVPKTFLFLPLISSSTGRIRLNHHLNDHIFISHYHEPEDGFSNLEDLGIQDDPLDRTSKYLFERPSSLEHLSQNRRISQKIIGELRALGNATKITPEIRRYLQNIVVFLRMERGVDGGITPFATTVFVALSKYLAPLHGIDFVTPDLVGLAARKVYPHRIVIASPDRERSVQYGGSVEGAEELLRDLTPEEIVENVLTKVQCPI